MAQAIRTRRALWLAIGALAILAMAMSAVGVMASDHDEISLTITSNSGQFEYDGLDPQVMSADKSQCKLTDGIDGPIVGLSATTWARNGSQIIDAPLGLVGGRLGVDKNGRGNDSSCGRIDEVEPNLSETLTVSLGDDLQTKVMTSLALNLDAKSGDTVTLRFFLDAEQPFETIGPIPATSSTIATPGSAFDAVEISAGTNSNVGITGGTFQVRDLIAVVPTVTVSPPAEVTPIGQDAVLDFTIDNSASEVPVAVEVRDTTTPGIPECTVTVAAGQTDSTSCSTTRTATEVENSVSFEAEVSAPGLDTQIIAVSPDPLNFLGGYACGAAITERGPGVVDDGPDVTFVLGPDKAGDPTDCAVPVSITTSGFGGTEQTVTVEPPDGITWTDVTGVVTIVWDGVVPDDNAIPRTLQVFPDSSEAEIPWCAELVEVTLVEVTLGVYHYQLADPEAFYTDATGDGDVCLILQSTETVEASGTVFTQTTEAYYVYEDPIFSRR